MQTPYDGYNFYAWAEKKLTQEEVSESDCRIYEIRRRISDGAELSRAITMPELRREGTDVQSSEHLERAYFVECVLHVPEAKQPRQTMFDIGDLVDLPPDGYPLSGTSMEGIRNMLFKRDPNSHKRHWAGIQYACFLRDSAEERLANRVLDHERALHLTED